MNQLNGLAHRLVQAHLLDEPQALAALEQARQTQLSLMSYLLKKQQVPAQQLAEIAAEEFGLPLCNLAEFDLDQAPFELISAPLLEKHTVFPLALRDEQLCLAIADPTDFQALEEVRFHTGLPVRAFVMAGDRLEKMLQRSLNKTTDVLLEDTQTQETDFNQTDHRGFENKDDAPVVRFIHQMLTAAITQGASDLHFEPYQNDYRIRFRIDGVLQDIAHPPSAFGPKLAARLKILSNLDISERRLPQDGRISLTTQASGTTDFRISTLPTLFGEKVVLRILDSSKTRLNIETLGMTENQQHSFLSALKKPQGMILVTGPTGSGKTVSLYTGLNILNQQSINISTAEDPIEIHLDGINQVNVNTKLGLDFASTLRALLRQDPDVIMVGEIRDLETANIAIKASQTGHLVLSTLHTNSAADTFTRLLNIGVAPFNLVSSIRMIIAQRLVRKLCDHCKKPASLDSQHLLDAGIDDHQFSSDQLFRAVGCDHCNGGYKGRTGIYEVVNFSAELAQHLLSINHTTDIDRTFAKAGFRTLRQAGLSKALAGETSLEEVYRVTLND
ncbi:type IV-A pilus assembly ATPase PilB [Saccharospirillum sp. MSK14-1]|nr:type IV-A pilus assembly ATPase PilB [Saccharospirillum sp. MSK14-1]